MLGTAPSKSSTGLGLTVSDVVRIVLTRVANEGALPVGLVANTDAHGAWFRAKVQEALNDPRAPLPHDDVEARFATRRAAALRRSAGWGVRIEWSPVVLDDRDRVFDYYDIEQESQRAAIAVDERIVRQIEVLIDSIVGRRRSCSSASAAS